MRRTRSQDGINRRTLLSALALLPALPGTLAFAAVQTGSPGRVLTSWREGPAKQEILDFVRATTEPSSSTYVAPDDRTVVFDQDGTLLRSEPGNLKDSRPAIRFAQTMAAL